MLDGIVQAGRAGASEVGQELLYETGMDALCDEVWVAFLDEESAALRLMNRDRMTREQALLRIRSQMPLADKADRAGVVIRTDKPVAEVRRDVAGQYRDLIKRIAR